MGTEAQGGTGGTTQPAVDRAAGAGLSVRGSGNTTPPQTTEADSGEQVANLLNATAGPPTDRNALPSGPGGEAQVFEEAVRQVRDVMQATLPLLNNDKKLGTYQDYVQSQEAFGFIQAVAVGKLHGHGATAALEAEVSSHLVDHLKKKG